MPLIVITTDSPTILLDCDESADINPICADRACWEGSQACFHGVLEEAGPGPLRHNDILAHAGSLAGSRELRSIQVSEVDDDGVPYQWTFSMHRNDTDFVTAYREENWADPQPYDALILSAIDPHKGTFDVVVIHADHLAHAEETFTELSAGD